MAQPDVRALVVSGPLQKVSLAYRNRAYVSEKIFPMIDSPSPDAKIGRYLKGAWFRDDAKMAISGTRAPRGGYVVDTVDIATKPYWFAKVVTEDDRRLSSLPNTPPLKPDQDAISFVTDKILLKREILAATAVLTATWSSISAGTDLEGAWAAGSGNTFISDVESKIEYIESQTGFRPNKLMLSANTLKELKMESTVLDRIKYTQRGIVSAELLAALFDLEEVVIAGAIKNTDKETKPGTEFTAARIWETNPTKGAAFLYYAPSAAGLMTPSSGYQVRRAYPNGQYRRIRTWAEAAENQDVYECAEDFQILQTGTDLGYLWKDTIST